MTVSVERPYFIGHHKRTVPINWIGNPNFVGTLGMLDAWNTQLKFYAKRMQVNAGLRGHALQPVIDPLALLDPLFPSSIHTGSLRVFDNIALNVNGGGGSNPTTAEAHFGFIKSNGTANPSTSGMLPPSFLGFIASGTDTNWFCRFINKSGVVLYSQNTGIRAINLARNTWTPHRMEMILDGQTNTVQWLIDGVVVGTFTLTSNTAPGQVAAGQNWQLIYNVNCSATVGTSDLLMMDFSFDFGGPYFTMSYADDVP